MVKQNIEDERRVFNNLIRKDLGKEPIPDYFYELIGLTRLRGKEKIKLLDIGCGRGIHSLNLNKQGFQTVGIDISPEAIKFARRKAKQERRSVEFFLRDATKTGFPRGNFKIVLFMGTLHHFYYSGLKKVINEAKRILKKEGKLILVEPNHLYPYNFIIYPVVHFFKKHSQGFLFRHRPPIFIRHITEMFTINERSLNPYDLFQFFEKDFKLVSLKFFPYTLALTRAVDSKSPSLSKKIREVFDNISSLLPEKYKYDYFSMKLVKK